MEKGMNKPRKEHLPNWRIQFRLNESGERKSMKNSPNLADAPRTMRMKVRDAMTSFFSFV